MILRSARSFPQLSVKVDAGPSRCKEGSLLLLEQLQPMLM